MEIVKVVCDANVLYSAALRDLLMELAVGDVFEPRWTEEIHGEWMRNVLQNNPNLTLEQLARTKNLMNASIKNCVVTGYEPIIPELELPDPGDRHVLAAAIHSRANFIVTFNLRDFPADNLRQYNIEPLHPDEFILRLAQPSTWQMYAKQQRNKESGSRIRQKRLTSIYKRW